MFFLNTCALAHIFIVLCVANANWSQAKSNHCSSSIHATEAYVNWLLETAELFRPERISCNDPDARIKIEQNRGSIDARPIILEDCGLMWDPSKFTLQYISAVFGEKTTKWHFASNGSSSLPHMMHFRSRDKYIKVKDATSKIILHESSLMEKFCVQEGEGMMMMATPPTYFNSSSDSAGAKLLYTALNASGLTYATPLYTIASTAAQLMVSPKDRNKVRPTEGFVSALLREKVAKAPVHPNLRGHDHESEIYFGQTFSGSSLHQHGMAYSASTGRKLWMLYGPREQCKVNEQSMGVFGLPPRCKSNTEKFMATGTPCIGQVHALEVLQHFSGLSEAGVAPLMYIQDPGEHFLIPEGWMHSTVNLESQLTLAHVFEIENGLSVAEREAFCAARLRADLAYT